MCRSLALALVLLPALPALAGGRTLALSTVVRNGTTKLKAGESQLSVRAPKNDKLSRAIGDTDDYVAISGTLNAKKTSRLFKLDPAKYYASPLNAVFSIQK